MGSLHRALLLGVLATLVATVVCCCRLPYSCTEQDIKNFFAGFDVNKVAWVSEPDGRPSGLVG